MNGGTATSASRSSNRPTKDLPPATVAVLRSMRAEGDRDRLDAYLRLLHLNGWTYRSLGTALGVWPQAVQQRVARNGRHVTDLPPVPLPPAQHQPMRAPRRTRLKVRPEVAETLRDLQTRATRVNGATPADSPDREASVQLSRALAALVEQGVTGYHLAQVLGVTPGAVYTRLARHGYASAYQSQATYQGHPAWTTDEGRPLTHCKRGHELAGENLRTLKDGRRVCRECDRRRGAEYRARRGGA